MLLTPSDEVEQEAGVVKVWRQDAEKVGRRSGSEKNAVKRTRSHEDACEEAETGWKMI